MSVPSKIFFCIRYVLNFIKKQLFFGRPKTHLLNDARTAPAINFVYTAFTVLGIFLKQGEELRENTLNSMSR